jgi:acyl carrier protein
MTRDEMMGIVQDIFRDIFDDDELLVKEYSNAETVEDWDSLAHINLVTAIEKEFRIRFALGELNALKDVGDMLDLIETKLK